MAHTNTRSIHELAQKRLKADPTATLRTALTQVAQEHGFDSWYALKADLDQRRAEDCMQFFEACTSGDADALRNLLELDETLVAARTNSKLTGLHLAAQHGRAEVVNLLLSHGADPNLRERGDNSHPLHWAAAKGHVAIVRALLDASADPHGVGDLHDLDVIGWATHFASPAAPAAMPQIVRLLVDHGAKHHIFSAIAIGDLQLVEELADELDRRMSRFEQSWTALHYAIRRKRHDVVDLLIELGADIEAEDGNGCTPLEFALVQGDALAAERLRDAGALTRERPVRIDMQSGMSKLSGSIERLVPFMNVPDVAKTLDWYSGIGFQELARFEDEGRVNWGMLSFGSAEIMVGTGESATQHASLWFYTDEVEQLYAVLHGQPIDFAEQLYKPFYGGKQFSIRDLNGCTLVFLQPDEEEPSPGS